MAGWVKLHRTITDSFVFQNPDRLKFWVWCLCKASHKDRKQSVGLQEVELKKGQFIFGRKKASSELGMDESKIYRLLKTFEKRDKIEVESNNKFSVVTIVNWAFYQDEEQQSEQQSNNKLTTNEQQMNTNKNVKKDKNVNKDTLYRKFDHLSMTLNEFENIKSKGYSKHQIDTVLDSIENYAKNKNYKSLNLTARKWLVREYGEIKENEPKNDTSDLPQWMIEKMESE